MNYADGDLCDRAAEVDEGQSEDKSSGVLSEWERGPLYHREVAFEGILHGVGETIHCHCLWRSRCWGQIYIKAVSTGRDHKIL